MASLVDHEAYEASMLYMTSIHRYVNSKGKREIKKHIVSLSNHKASSSAHILARAFLGPLT